MKTLFTISNVELSTVHWKLLYDPSQPVPFMTLEGTEHVWNWDFTCGNLIKDGEPLLGSEGYSIQIELWYEEQNANT